MDTRKIEFVAEIAKQRSITRAARELFISQPALNQQLLNLEKELGTPLFVRSRGECIPTQAGEIYLEAGKKILAIKQQAYREIAEISDKRREDLRLGVTFGKGSAMLAEIYKELYQKFPEVVLKVRMMTSHDLQELVRSGELDLAVITATEPQLPDFSCQVLREEELLLLTHRDDPAAANAVPGPSGPVADLRDFADEGFCLASRGGVTYTLTLQAFDSYGIAPPILNEGGGFELVCAMIQAGAGCGMIEEHHEDKLPPEVRAYRMSIHPKVYALALTRKGHQPNQAEQKVVELARRYWQNL